MNVDEEQRGEQCRSPFYDSRHFNALNARTHFISLFFICFRSSAHRQAQAHSQSAVRVCFEGIDRRRLFIYLFLFGFFFVFRFTNRSLQLAENGRNVMRARVRCKRVNEPSTKKLKFIAYDE